MSESQDQFTYSEDTINAIKKSLSEPRFSAYLKRAGGDETFAIALYLYNIRLAKAFLFPLGITEVVFRNAVDAALIQAHGRSWHQDQYFRNQVLNPPSLKALDKTIQRIGSIDKNKAIAGLSFDFWSNLFRSDYENLWQTNSNAAFPGLQRGEGRHDIQVLAKEINLFRNRVAHHEPILNENVPDLQSKMIKLTSLRCVKTSDWMRYHTTVNMVMRSRPKLQ